MLLRDCMEMDWLAFLDWLSEAVKAKDQQCSNHNWCYPEGFAVTVKPLCIYRFYEVLQPLFNFQFAFFFLFHFNSSAQKVTHVTQCPLQTERLMQIPELCQINKQQQQR